MGLRGHFGRFPVKALAALLALAVCCLLPAAAPAAKRHKRPHPIYWGAWIGPQMTGTAPPHDMSGVTAFEGLVGKGLSLVGFASPFATCATTPCSFYDFPTEGMENVRRYGAIPFLSWGSQSIPWLIADPIQPDFQLSDVIAGTYDEYIRKFALESRAWGHPYFLRFDWEMNGNWFPWSEGVNGNNPGEFVAAWRHVHDIFSAVGATNATWVWCPFADANKQRLGNMSALYPGSEYVDWACLDGYNWGTTSVNPHPWKSFGQIFTPAYERLTKRVAPGKPILLGEFASSPYGGHKALWIRNALAKLPTKFPRIRGLLWFDGVDRGIDWPIETSASVTREFAGGIRKRLYVGNAYAELATSPIGPPG
jgi:mannan endo-1,4-beta-mannosidase